MARTHRMAARSRGAGQGGFTLMELLVALAITVIGLAGLMSLHVSMMKGNRSASQTAEASTMAQEVIEDLRGMPVAAIADKFGPLPINGYAMSTADGRTGLTYTRTLSVRPVSGNLLWIRVVVAWADDGADPSTVDEQYKHEVALELIRTSLEAP